MKVIRVRYTVKEGFTEENKRNIKAVMNELREIGNSDIKYASYLLDDEKTFMHLVQYNSEEAENLPSSLDSFKHFQKELKENLETPPKAENFDLVDSSFNLF